MEKMLFTTQQPEVTVIVLPDGKRDVTVLTNEEIVVLENLSAEEAPSSEMMFQYDGNQFRTVYELTEEEILEDLKKYLEYSTENEPTMEELEREKEILQSYENGLMKAVKEAVNSD